MPPTPPDRHRGPCPVQQAAAVLGDKWAVPVVGRLARGETRFGRLRSQVADADGQTVVSSKALASQLVRLAESGVVERRERGAAVAYRLTRRGHALVPLLDALGEWADGPDPDVTTP